MTGEEVGKVRMGKTVQCLSSDFILSSRGLHWKVLGEVLRSTPGVIVRAQLMKTTMVIAGSDLNVGHVIFF